MRSSLGGLTVDWLEQITRGEKHRELHTYRHHDQNVESQRQKILKSAQEKKGLSYTRTM